MAILWLKSSMVKQNDIHSARGPPTFEKNKQMFDALKSLLGRRQVWKYFFLQFECISFNHLTKTNICFCVCLKRYQVIVFVPSKFSIPSSVLTVGRWHYTGVFIINHFEVVWNLYLGLRLDSKHSVQGFLKAGTSLNLTIQVNKFYICWLSKALCFKQILMVRIL